MHTLMASVKESTQRVPYDQSWHNLSNKFMLDCDPKYEVNIYEYMLVQDGSILKEERNLEVGCA